MNYTDTKEKTQIRGKIKWPEIILSLIGFAFARVGFYEYFYTVGIAYIGSLYSSK